MTQQARDAPKAQWGEPLVQMVYEILCADDPPPGDDHWEGWFARRIVDALTAALAQRGDEVTKLRFKWEKGAIEGVWQLYSNTKLSRVGYVYLHDYHKRWAAIELDQLPTFHDTCELAQAALVAALTAKARE